MQQSAKARRLFQFVEAMTAAQQALNDLDPVTRRGISDAIPGLARMLDAAVEGAALGLTDAIGKASR